LVCSFPYPGNLLQGILFACWLDCEIHFYKESPLIRLLRYQAIAVRSRPFLSNKIKWMGTLPSVWIPFRSVSIHSAMCAVINSACAWY
jgi:hypothetical protein